jgi:ribonucleoside-diphosphate reductase alpha chain
VHIKSFFTKNNNPYDGVEFETRTALIKEPTGKVIFEGKATVPSFWSQTATDILAQKYFRRKGLSQNYEKINEPEIPSTFQRSKPKEGSDLDSGETNLQQTLNRMAGCWTYWGLKYGYFSTESSAQDFYNDLVYMMCHQMAAPNSPQWFNTGLNWAYGIEGPPQGHAYVDPADGQLKHSTSAYERPQPHACLPASAMIATDQGYKSILELQEERYHSIWDGKSWTPLKAFKRTGTKPLLRVTLADGSFFTATPDHIVKANRARFRKRKTFTDFTLSELTVGDYLAKCYSPKGFGDTRMVTPGQAACIAWLIGDGFCGRSPSSTSFTWEFIGKTKEEGEIIRGLVAGHWAPMIPGCHILERETQATESSELMTRIRGYGKGWEPICQTLGVVGTCYNARVPAYIFSSPKEVTSSFLSYLFEAEGGVRKDDVNFTTTSEGLARDVQLLLNQYGIAGQLYFEPDFRDNRVGSWKVLIGSPLGWQLFQNEIGFVSPTKRKLLADLVAEDRPSRDCRKGIHPLRISKIESLDPEPVYDIETESHYFVSDAICVHNCFILNVEDHLVNPDGIMDLWVKEARIFKYGSGVGSNFSKIRGENEPLSGGGKSSGLLSFLRVGDRSAGAIKSGGTCYRKGSMVLTPEGHKPIEELKIGDKVLTHSGPQKVLDFMENGIRDIIRIETTDGYQLDITATHRLAYWDWEEGIYKAKPWEEFNIGDDLCVLVSPAMAGQDVDLLPPDEECSSSRVKYPTTLNPDIAYILGLYYGDTGEIPQRKDFPFDLAFLEKNQIQKGSRGSLGFPKGIHTASMATRAAFIAGLIDSDKNPIKRSSYTISSLDKSFLQQAQLILLSLGIPAKIKPIKKGQDSSRSLWRLVIVDVFTEILHHLIKGYCKKSSGIFYRGTKKGWNYRKKIYHHFKTLAGSEESIKDISQSGTFTEYSAVQAITASTEVSDRLLSYARTLTTSVPTKIAAITVLGIKDETYDIEVADAALLSANGVYAHNTRRAAKMVVLDDDHPDILEFAQWKVREEQKVAALSLGSKLLNRCQQELMAESAKKGKWDPKKNKHLAGVIKKFLDLGTPSAFIKKVIQQGSQENALTMVKVLETDWTSEAYETVSGQNANNTIRLTNAFLKAVEEDSSWNLYWRTDKSKLDPSELKPCQTLRARDIWEVITGAAWASADPGLQFTDTINEWHTCPSDGPIRASNPCSEYLFLDDTACNLASINLLKFYDEAHGIFNVPAFAHSVKLWTIVLEISVLMAQFPSESIARGSYLYRTLGLGYANLGALLMRMGIPYDSETGRNIAGAITAILQGVSMSTSADMAAELGPFPRYTENEKSILKVAKNHWLATKPYPSETSQLYFEDLTITPVTLDPNYCPFYLHEAAKTHTKEAYEKGKVFGYRNAQFTVIAPTGTIAFVMGCDTTGIEPDLALVKHKTLAGGGAIKIINQSVTPALEKLGYPKYQIKEILEYCVGNGKFPETGSKYLNISQFKTLGMTSDEVEDLQKKAVSTFDIRYILPAKVKAYLDSLTQDERESLIQETNTYVCGTMGIEGAPYLKQEHYPVFDCANKCGLRGKRFIEPPAHIKMMAAVQPFISGAISKTINMPAEASIADVSMIYRMAHHMMLKAVAIYRDGSKLSQPLNAVSEFGLEDLAQESITQQKKQPEKEPLVLQPKVRQILPTRRIGYTQKARISGHTVYLHTGEYTNGSLGEIFMDSSKAGAPFSGLLNSFAISVSLGLQYGVPLEEYVNAFVGTKFEPHGIVEGNSHIKMCTSLLDYIFRELGITYLQRFDLAHTSPEQLLADITPQENPPDYVIQRLLQPLRGIHIPTPEKQIPIENLESKLKTVKNARALGYEGEPCGECGSWTMIRSGTCMRCETCGATSGCS